jgi:hypothetical protein
MLRALQCSLGALLADRSWQSGAYQATVVPALAGDAALSNALHLEDDGLACGDGGGGGGAAAGGDQRAGMGGGLDAAGGAARPPYEHPRFHLVEAEEHHLVSGPSRVAAAALFARHLLDHALGLHRTSVHLVHAVEVLLAPAGPGAAVAGGAAAAEAAAAPGSSGGGVFGYGCEAGWRAFELGELLTPDGRLVRGGAPLHGSICCKRERSGSARTCVLCRVPLPCMPAHLPTHPQAAERLLAAAARGAPEGLPVGRLRVFAAVREGAYVPVVKALAFQHQGVAAPLEARGGGGSSGGAEGCWCVAGRREGQGLQPHARRPLERPAR